MSDGGDSMAGFNPAKDVIDLSHIDANITTAGVQNFTFIGSAAFTGAGGQVRYQLDPTRNVTYVQVALAGDKSADLTITLMGLLPLTAANFALTAAQSSADLAAGALETYSKVQTSGASSEYLHSNIAGRAYTSIESFSGPGYGNLAANELNLSSTADELLCTIPTRQSREAPPSSSCRQGRARTHWATIPSRPSTPRPAGPNISSSLRASALKRSRASRLRAQARTRSSSRRRRSPI